jgi:5-methylcytosine-specific restriction endonuclease McrA
MTTGTTEPSVDGIPPDVREGVLERDRHQCLACGRGGENQLHLHHWVYRSAGGVHEPWCLITLCIRCHELWHFNPKLFRVVVADDGTPQVFMKRMKR